ncbi:phage tail tape measure protein [Pandoraea apista]|uniref:Phage tail length tape measure protein n=1 Tax=Pandoraea apista TaxID=93218 RepID=A0A5E5P614_9BURK|nr:phage tail tape measure protein [Pandoraea apista]AJF00049.1 phage tail length tape measure protein [Pandoraea apista]AKH74204.1 phage tail length tape measure protein [Pandoraea apista]AKI62753.1 phage tail length tape measure protein [Pandoraea apista]VVG72098.1 phage tail length tape measure protein [Pandoraea apista]
MSSSVDVAVKIKVVDAGAEAAIQKHAKTAEQAANTLATSTEKAAQKAADATEKSASRQRSSYERLSQARENLGVRSERAIQREIQQTEASYNRLTRSGTMSWREQAAAASKMREKVTELTNEMGRLTNAQKAYAGLKFTGAAVAGVGAAAYTLRGPAERAMSYDRRLANMANTAFSERDENGRKIGKTELESAVNAARRFGGGTREQAAEALDTMIASGVVSDRDAMTMLPGIMKAATASVTDANAMATIAIRAKQSFKIDAADIPQILSAAMVAGQAGGFELRDMAKWLPQQMAMASNLGLSGKDGFAKLAAWNQASVITSGTRDEGGNNLRDLLNELNTPHFRKYMAEQYLANGQKLKRGEKEKRLNSVDEVFLDYQSRGVDKVDATIDMMQSIFAKNAKYQELQAKLRSIDKNDKEGQRQIIEAMAAQVQGTAVGKVFHNQQSLMAFLGVMNNQAYTNDVLDKVRGQYGLPEARSEIATSFKGISDTSDFKVEQAKEDAAVAQKSAMDNLTPAIGKVADAFADLAQQHPLLVGTTALATTALGALAGAAGLASIAMGGRGAAGGAIGRAAAWATGSAIGRGVMTAGKVGGIAGIGALAGDYALGKAFGDDSAITRYGSGALNGAAIGATIGSVVPVLGTGIGAAGGAALGLAWEGIKDLLKPAEQKPVDVNARMTVGLAPGLVLQSQSVQATGGNVQMNTGNVWNGAP